MGLSRPVRLPPRPGGVEQIPPIRGVRSSQEHPSHPPDLAYELENCFPLDPTVGAGVWGRPGFVFMAQLAQGRVQAIHQLSKLDGTEITLAICNGEIYTWNWATSVASVAVSAANLSAAGISLQSNVDVYVKTFTDQVVVSDGVNTPFLWDGTSGGGLTLMNNCPVLYGQPVIHYAKLFGIKNSERTALVWSEENQPNTGYEAGGFNNAWTLGQTESDRLETLIATNEALYYQRRFSTGAIWGAVTTDFRTTGTHEGVAETVGSRSPGAWVVAGSNVWFVDSAGRVQAFPLGGDMIDPPPWVLSRNLTGRVYGPNVPGAKAWYREDLGVVQFAVPVDEGAENTEILNFDAESGVYMGHFTGAEVAAVGEVIDGDGNAVIMHGNSSGYTWFHSPLLRGEPDVLNDQDSAGQDVAIPHVIETAPMGHSVRLQKLFEEYHLAFLARTTTDIVVKFHTERGEVDPGLSWRGVNDLGTRWDEFDWDDGSWDAAYPVEVRSSFGAEVYGRWLRLRIEHEKLGEAFAFVSGEVKFFVEGADARSLPDQEVE